MGTTFKIFLPPAPEEPRKIIDHGADRSARGTEAILLVEDEASVRQLALPLPRKLFGTNLMNPPSL